MSRLMQNSLIGVLTCLVSGCVSLPTGPSVMVLPGTGLSFEQFVNDEAVCKQYAYVQIGGTTANEASVTSGATTAAAGTAIGAAAGAAIGGGTGAAIGAGAGLATGGVVGAGAADRSYYGTQRAYDNVFIQCMYAKGHRVPVHGQFSDQPATPPVKPRAPNIPPPPPGTPPAPPPGR